MRALIVVSIAASLVVAGCGTRVEPSIGTSPPSPTASASPAASGSPAATATLAPTVTAAASPTATATATVAASPSPAPTASASPAPSPSPSESPASQLPQGSDPVTLDPANFGTVIDNPYWPMAPGTVWTHREVEADGTELTIVVTVTDETKEILGITTVVVHDVVTEDGETVEDTFDWYAQDLAGNIWYMGEATQEFSDGEIDTAGSWEAGVDGALPGILVPANPTPGLTYRQEYYAGEAEDAAAVLSLDERVEVAAGSYEGLLMTKEYTPLEPDILEYKFYAPGVGPVLALAVSGGSAREELTKFEPATP
jgi:hypothetical protein